MRKRITSHLNLHKIIPSNHHGCGKGYSTLSAMQKKENIPKKNKAKSRNTIKLSTDLSNAFDLIDHQILLQKFEHIGVRGKAYFVIQSYLEDRNIYCEVQGFNGAFKK